MNAYETECDFLKTIAHTTRLAILDILRDGEQCVCHIEAMLGLRQAYTSQQLRILKEAGLLEVRRDRLNLYYRVCTPEVFTVLDALRSVHRVTPAPPPHKHAKRDCPCPKCNAMNPETSPAASHA